MFLRTLSRFGARLVSVLLLAVCARDAAAPVGPAAAPDSANAALLGLLPVRGVTRTMPLAQDITVSAVIGSNGGTLTIPEAGLTLVVPAGAVSSDVTFTATALAGKIVAYDFEPHGTKFAVPLQFNQDLRKTNLLATVTTSRIDGAYFDDKSRLNQASGTAFVSEVRSATVNLLQFRASFPIDHFSGYLISWH